MCKKIIPLYKKPDENYNVQPVALKIKRAKTLPCAVLVEKWPAVRVSEKKSLVKDVAVGR